MIEITKLSASHEENYEDLLQACPWAMVYHSLVYRNFLKEFLPGAVEDYYFLALENDKVIGALPCFLVDGPLGIVLNSLPFFGSHGSVLLRPGVDSEAVTALVDALMGMCRERNVVFCTVIETPYYSSENVLKHKMGFQYKDQRIGQFTSLPDTDSVEQVGNKLLAMYHQKTRNIVRKALRGPLVFSHESGRQALDALYALHKNNLIGIGGIAKPQSFFTSITNQLKYDRDYRIYTARTNNGEIVCALMLLYFKETVEYFVPATDEGWRSAQPLSGLIYLAMRDAVLERGARNWNWGGTWLTQNSVFHFKSRWGTLNQPYFYYTRVFSDTKRLQDVNRQALLRDYPWFYTIPFSVLEK